MVIITPSEGVGAGLGLGLYGESGVREASHVETVITLPAVHTAALARQNHGLRG